MSEHNITVQGGSAVRLKTAGKYCDRDILVSATPGGVDLPELTNEGTDSDLMYGKQLINGAGKAVTGSFTLDSELSAQDTLISQIKVALAGKAAGGGGGDDMVGALAARTITEFSSSGCTAIGDYSFRGCKSLQTVVAPNATRVGEYAFYQCNNLKSIVLPSVITVATNSFRDAQYLEVVDLPKLPTIPSNTFYGCRGLMTLILRYSKKVTLNASSAFTTCYRMLGTTNSGFNPNGERLGFVYVPRALVGEYQADSVWSSVLEQNQFRAIEDYPDICG